MLQKVYKAKWNNNNEIIIINTSKVCKSKWN